MPRCVIQEVKSNPGVSLEDPRAGTRVFYFHHPSQKSMDESVRQGCHFCAIISNLLFGGGGDRSYHGIPGLGDRIVLTGSWLDKWALEKNAIGRFVHDFIHVQFGDKK